MEPINQEAVPTPAINEPKSILKKSNAKNLSVLIIGLTSLLVLVSIILALFARSQKAALVSIPSPSPTISPTSNPTAEWETYYGDGYSFRIPANYQVANNKNTTLVTTEKGLTILSIVSEPTIAKNAREYVDITRLGMVDFVTVNGIEIVNYLNDTPGVPMEAYTFVVNGKAHHITDQVAANPNLSKVFHQILSTFRFLDNDYNI